MSIEIRETTPERAFQLVLRNGYYDLPESELHELVEKGAEVLGLHWWQAGGQVSAENTRLRGWLERIAKVGSHTWPGSAMAQRALDGEEVPEMSDWKCEVCGWIIGPGGYTRVGGHHAALEALRDGQAMNAKVAADALAQLAVAREALEKIAGSGDECVWYCRWPEVAREALARMGAKP